MFCSDCGAKIEDGMAFCPKCGAACGVSAQNMSSVNSAPYGTGQNSGQYATYPQYGQYQQNAGFYAQPQAAYYPPAKKSKAPVIIALVVVFILLLIFGIIAASIFIPSMSVYMNKVKLKTANTNAKTAYNVVEEYFEQHATDDQEVQFYLNLSEGVVYDCSEDGEDGSFQHELYKTFNDYGDEAGYVFVGTYTTSYGSMGVFVQWSEEKGGNVIGQYPSPIVYSENDVTVWGTYSPAIVTSP